MSEVLNAKLPVHVAYVRNLKVSFLAKFSHLFVQMFLWACHLSFEFLPYNQSDKFNFPKPVHCEQTHFLIM
jgi:hypothetical protein